MRSGLPAAAILAVLLLGIGPVSASPEGASPTTGPDAPPLVRLCFEDSDIAPWRFRNHTGLNFLMLDAVAREAGVRLQYQARPWRRCQDDLRAGRVDGAFGMSYTPERASFVAYPGGILPDASRRMFEGGYLLVRRAGSRVEYDGVRITGLEGPIGAEPSHSIALDLIRAGYEVDDGSPSPEALLRKLRAGRLAAAAIGTDQVNNFRAEDPGLLDGLEVLPVPLVDKPYFLVFSKSFASERPALAERLWDAIAVVRESAAYQTALAAARGARRGIPEGENP
jgi:polar amino acid transport system substrate-binding protein